MPVIARQAHLARRIDTHVRHVLAQGGGDEVLLLSLAAYMGTFKQLLDTCTGANMDALCARYNGFYRFVKLLERLADGIADGSGDCSWREDGPQAVTVRATGYPCPQAARAGGTPCTRRATPQRVTANA